MALSAVNMASIMNKVGAYSRSADGKLRMKEYLEQCRVDGRRETHAGGRVITEGDMAEAAEKLISVLRSAAGDYDLPESVIRLFGTLNYTPPVLGHDGNSTVYVYFGGDLRRDSLEDGAGGFTGGGIDNIVALLNNGAHASNYVYGWWNGHSPTGESIYRSGGEATDYAWVRSKKDRGALRFIQRAIDDFNGNYGDFYKVTAVPGEDYT